MGDVARVVLRLQRIYAQARCRVPTCAPKAMTATYTSMDITRSVMTADIPNEFIAQVDLVAKFGEARKADPYLLRNAALLRLIAQLEESKWSLHAFHKYAIEFERIIHKALARQPYLYKGQMYLIQSTSKRRGLAKYKASAIVDWIYLEIKNPQPNVRVRALAFFSEFRKKGSFDPLIQDLMSTSEERVTLIENGPLLISESGDVLR